MTFSMRDVGSGSEPSDAVCDVKRSLTTFPMEKLCYDLKLEVIDQLDPDDVVQVFKTNNEFRSIYLRKPWRVLGKGVYSIEIGPYVEVLVKKTHDSAPISFDLLAEKAVFLESIRTVFELTLNLRYRRCTDVQVKAVTKLLASIKEVNGIRPILDGSHEFEEILSNFNPTYLDSVYLGYTSDSFDFLSRYSGSLLKNMKECVIEGISPYQFQEYYDTLSMTETEMIFIEVNLGYSRYSLMSFDELVRLVVTRGIPSKSPHGFFMLQGINFTKKSKSRKSRERHGKLHKYFTEEEGVVQISREEKMKVWRKANEMLKKYSVMRKKLIGKRMTFRQQIYNSETRKKLIGKRMTFKQQIYKEQECIYAVNDYFLFAKYVSPIQGNLTC